MSENDFEWVTPLKGPFKGKGQQRRHEKQLTFEMENIELEMQQLIHQFNSTLPRPRPVNLVMIHRTWPLLWWREPKTSGNFIRLFETTNGQILLKNMLPASQNVYVDFDRNRAIMNYRSRVVGNTLKAIQLFRESTKLHESFNVRTAAPCRKGDLDVHV